MDDFNHKPASPSEDKLTDAAPAADENPPAAAAIKEDNSSKFSRLKTWPKAHKKTFAAVLILLVLLILGLIPWSRYQAAGLVLKNNFSLRVVDADTNQPVSGATVTIGKSSAETDAAGLARLHTRVGQQIFLISKKYYASSTLKGLVPLLKQKNTPTVSLQATGRQVNINVSDLLSKKPLANVDIEVAGISATTDTKGSALLVLPAGVSEQAASLSLNGYNDAKATIKVSDQTTAQNNLTMTPAGKIYFLSKRTGKLNVMKANLDGTDAEVVVSATGYEQVDSSALSQSPDGKYVALETQRNASDETPQLYIFSTSDEQLLTFDSGNYNFSIIGWAGDKLIYQATNKGDQAWQAGRQAIKSYDATTGKTIVLDSSAGTDVDTDASETYGNIYLTANKIVFSKGWESQPDNKKNTIQSVNFDGSSKQVVASYDAATTTDYLYQYAPNSFYIQLHDTSSNSADATYFDYTVGGSFKKVNAPGDDQLSNNPAYYFSPDDSKSYWSEIRDGQETLITADAYGSAYSQKVQASDFEAAGWYTDKYLLSTNKDQNELYIMAIGGAAPVKVADYQSTYVY